MKTSIGKVTLGGGKKMVTALNNYRRSTHDLSFIFRSSMAPGVLVPSMKLLMTPGDTFKIKTRCHTLTHPTVGPLFGSFKQQNDFFFCPIRLYNAMLHNNALNIGLKMSQVKLPVMQWKYDSGQQKWLEGTNETLKKMVHPSALFAYLGIRGLHNDNEGEKNWQCVPILAYYDIFKNYYANKQEEKFYVVSGPVNLSLTQTGEGFYFALAKNQNDTWTLEQKYAGYPISYNWSTNAGYTAYPSVVIQNLRESIDINNLRLYLTFKTQGNITEINDTVKNLLDQGVIQLTTIGGNNNTIALRFINYEANGTNYNASFRGVGSNPVAVDTGSGTYNSYDLKAIDDLREAILAAGRNQFIVNSTNAPFIQDQLENAEDGIPACASPMTGLCLKTYQSDINVNWINTEWIDGDNGINEVTAIDTSSGSFTIDQLNLASKVYRMLNRIAVSDGSYNAWIQTVFTAGGLNHIETPIYLGSSSMEIEFQEVISNSATTDEPLGTLAGRGIATNKKGGNIRFKADEPGYIMCITSLTPRVDYYQGNDWDVYLETLDDLHKPQLDGIGFQDRLYRNMNAQVGIDSMKKSIGKQPAWIEYMTNVNKTYGNFAIEQNEGFMCLNRVFDDIDTYTTYVQPHLYNNIFADTDITAQNFWVQIGFDIEARRVMSAKIIPNL